MVEHVEALDNVRVVNVAEDLDLAADMEALRLLVVAVDDLESVDPPRWAVEDLVDGAAGAGTDAVGALQVREAHRGMVMVVGGGDGGCGRGGGGRGGRKRKGHGEGSIALGQR